MLSGTWTSQKRWNQVDRVCLVRPIYVAMPVSDSGPSSHEINSANRAAWVALVLGWVVLAPQCALHRQRWVPFDVVPLRFIGPLDTWQVGGEQVIHQRLLGMCVG